MKLLVLMICLAYAMANENVLQQIESMLASKHTSADPAAVEAEADRLMANLINDVKAKRDFPKFGYCRDGKTPAEGKHEKGCDAALCYDKDPKFCSKVFAGRSKTQIVAVCKNTLNARTECKRSCNLCKSRASPKRTCDENDRSRAPFGCCAVGNVPAMTPDKSDCQPCADLHPKTCATYKTSDNGVLCQSTSWGIQTFLEKNCFVTCKKCVPGQL